MIVSEIKLFELLKARIGEKEAEAFVEILETKVDSKFEENKELFITVSDKEKLLTKADAIAIFATKEDMAKSIGDLEVRLTRAIYIVGLVQYLAILASVAAVIKLLH